MSCNRYICGVLLAVSLVLGQVRAGDLAEELDKAIEQGKADRVRAILRETPSLARLPNKPLEEGIRSGKVEIVKILLECGADPNVDYGYRNVFRHFTPLSDAVLRNSFDIAQLLCQHGADAKVSGGKHQESLFLYAVINCEPRFVELLLKQGANPNETIPRAPSALELTALQGDIDKAKLLLSFGANINAQTEDGATPLLLGAACGQVDFCKFLLSRGARLDLHSACALGMSDQALTLLKASPHLVEAPDPCFGRSPLHWAAQGGSAALVRFLLDHGSQVNVGAQYAASDLRGAERVRKIRSRDTPLHVAAENGHKEVAALLLHAGAYLDARDVRNATPLHYAAYRGQADLAGLLLDSGADVNARDRFSQTPLKYAEGEDTRENKKVMELLRKRGGIR